MAVNVSGELVAVNTRQFTDEQTGEVRDSHSIRVLDTLAGDVHVVYVGRDFPAGQLAELNAACPRPGEPRAQVLLDVFVSKKGSMYANSATVTTARPLAKAN